MFLKCIYGIMLKFVYGYKSYFSDVRVLFYGDLIEIFFLWIVMVVMDGSEDFRFVFYCKYI